MSAIHAGHLPIWWVCLVQNKPHIQFKLVLVLCVKTFFKVKNTNAILRLRGNMIKMWCVFGFKILTSDLTLWICPAHA